MKPRIRYGVLDEFGEVVRWQFDKPSGSYKYITERIKAVDVLASLEPAPF